LVLITGAGFAQSFTVSLTGSLYNGYGVPCFGMQDGNIVSTVTGGTAPYTYTWSNGATTANVTGVPAGYYKLKVVDTNGIMVEAEITLTEPEPLKVDGVAYKYPNGKNISCYECFNGSVDVNVTQGTAPYTYTWSDAGPTIQDRTGLGAKSYTVTVRDANGCEEKYEATLDQPDRSDWTMTGNAGTNPGTQYIGTSDAQDVVFKSNGTEQLRLKSNGDISLLGSLTSEGPLYRTEDGTLRSGFLTYPEIQPPRCHLLGAFPYWETDGNAFDQLCNGIEPLLGTTGNRPLNIITNGQKRMVVAEDGRVGIGTVGPQNALAVRFTTDRGGLDLENGRTDPNANSEIRFLKNATPRWRLGTDLGGVGTSDFYLQEEGVGTGYRLLVDPLGLAVQYNDERGGLRLVNAHPGQGVSSELSFYKGVSRRGALGLDFGMNGSQDLYFFDQLDNALRLSVDRSRMVLNFSNDQRGTLDLDNNPTGLNSSSEVRFLKQGQVKWTVGHDFDRDGGRDFYIWDQLANEGAGATRLRIDETGRVVIGDVAAPNGYRLFVAEGILTERVKVAIPTTQDWSDNVFQTGYYLMPLQDVNNYIVANGHLPGVPTAECMVESGLDVAKSDALLLRKIEELTIHAIECERRIQELDVALNKLFESFLLSKNRP